MARAEEVPLVGGQVTPGVVRIGATVRRPASANTKFAARLLLYLEHAGFDAAPRFLGYDEQGRQILSYVEGQVPSDCRTIIWTDEQLEASMRLLRRFHDSTAGSELTNAAELVCHNDYGPWNLVWRAGLPAAIIDFDNAAPGSRLRDLGYAAWKHLNLGLIDLPVCEQRRRLHVLAKGYGRPCDHAWLSAIHERQAEMRRLIEAAASSDERTQALAQIAGERRWLRCHGAELFA